MEKRIKISVIIPVYNTEEYLGQCLDSLYVQAFRDIEYILVDDGSTDASYDLCLKYAGMDERFVAVRKENGGPSSARNLGLSMARGEYISFVDSDDFVRADAYARIAELLDKHSDPDCLIFGANLVPDNAPPHYYHLVTTADRVYEGFTPKMLYNEPGTRPFLWLQVIRKAVIEDSGVRMDESISLGEDQLFQIELFPYMKRIVFSSEKLYYYRWQRAGSLMSENARNAERKLLLHVGLADRVLSGVFTDRYGTDMKLESLKWSVDFLWNDLRYMLEEPQHAVASRLALVWDSYGCRDMADLLDEGTRARLEHILIMAIEDRDERILAQTEANAKLEKRLLEYRSLPEYRRIAKRVEGRETLFGKVVGTLRREGLRATLAKIKRRLKNS